MRLQTACGCMTLQTGARILASLSLVLSIILAIVLGVVMGNLDDQRSMNLDVTTMRPVCLALILMLLINFSLSGLMIFGSVRKNPGYMFPWIALGFTGIVYYTIAFGVLVIIGGIFLPIGLFFRMLAFNMPIAVLKIYFWLILYSHYKELLAMKYGTQPDSKDGKVFFQPMNPYHNI